MLLQRIRGKVAHYGLIGECLLELLRTRHAISRRPFDETAQTLRRPLAAVDIPSEEERTARRVRAALGSIRRRLPWKPTCLVRAIAAHRMLARRGIASHLVLSVAPASGSMIDAHAWLEAGGLVVTGRDERARYMPIYTFSNARHPDEQSVQAERARPCSS
jgi:hypothetical protein